MNPLFIFPNSNILDFRFFRESEPQLVNNFSKFKTHLYVIGVSQRICVNKALYSYDEIMTKGVVISWIILPVIVLWIIHKSHEMILRNILKHTTYKCYMDAYKTVITSNLYNNSLPTILNYISSSETTYFGMSHLTIFAQQVS